MYLKKITQNSLYAFSTFLQTWIYIIYLKVMWISLHVKCFLVKIKYQLMAFSTPFYSRFHKRALKIFTIINFFWFFKQCVTIVSKVVVEPHTEAHLSYWLVCWRLQLECCRTVTSSESYICKNTNIPRTWPCCSTFNFLKLSLNIYSKIHKNILFTSSSSVFSVFCPTQPFSFRHSYCTVIQVNLHESHLKSDRSGAKNFIQHRWDLTYTCQV